MNAAYLKQQLVRHEGIRHKLYRDSVGKASIGIGRNIDDEGVSDDEIELMYQNDVRSHMKDLTDHVEWWSSLDEVRQMVLVNLCFNIGITRLLGFQKMLAALQAGDYPIAAKEMMNSTWATQVKARALELSHQMETGELL